jgi:deoxycytidylate deaminase
MKNLTNTIEEKDAIKWMNEAGKVAQQALCLKAKCGTVIVSGNEIIGRGYNAPPLDKEENRYSHICLFLFMLYSLAS